MNIVPEFHSKTRARREDRLIERYIGVLGMCSVFVGAPVQQIPVKVGYNAEIVGRATGARFIIWEREWCRSAKEAQAVVSETLSRLQPHRIGVPQNGWIDVDVTRAHRTVHEAAQASGVHLTANQRVQDRGREFLERAEQKIFSMSRDGSLRALNKTFKAQRIEAQLNGHKMPNYQEVLDAYMHETFVAVARSTIGAPA